MAANKNAGEYKVMSKVFIVNSFKKITTRKNVTMYVGNVITSHKPDRIISMISFESQLGERLLGFRPDSTIAIHNCIVNYDSVLQEENSLKTTRTTKIFPMTTPFEYDASLVDSYRDSKVVEYEEILNSPKKRRVSVDGRIASVQMYNSSSHQRQVLCLEDKRKRTISVTLWENEEQVSENQMVTIKNLEVTENPLDLTKQLSSTEDTRIETTLTERKCTIVIDGIDTDKCTISDEIGTSFTATPQVVGSVNLGQKCNLILNGDHIVELETVALS